MAALPQTPSQTVGPFFHEGLVRPGENVLVREGATDARIVLTGQVFDGDGQAVPDALLEIWQADGAGRYPQRSEAAAAFRGFGRSDTRHADDCFRFESVKPGRVTGPGGAPQAPHVCVRIFARGLLTHLSTRVYFADEAAANEADPVLRLVPAERRGTLLATRAETGESVATYRWNIVLQGAGETVFFEP
jgi:protocatechuate 3,4-dioxygenase alpha subunit